ncbi:hypothetical protein T552_00764 [Pneumocystis carinii B80]|uniref:polynucleotide adenylyltransferase n=1 Tax=Pneumocystis carinii (strain B80) TaxID=1408658 RepID=A0A0W4ZPJ6_PNEC8|nr:hypothetical protein T552_00764 [Pneumocystis carinii B80]KTW30289.1 hypothetical protein T552_00764 [Pneumocystis carinii B80]
MDSFAQEEDYIKFDFSDEELWKKIEKESFTPSNTKKSFFQKTAAKMESFFKRKHMENDTLANKRFRREIEAPWVKDYSGETSVSRILHREILDFSDFISPTKEEHFVRELVIQRIDSLIQKHWKNVQLCAFGSFDTMLYLPTSDIDLVILSLGSRIYETKKDLHKLSRYLRSSNVAKDIQVITGATVPIIKYIDTLTQIHVDISFNKPGGLVSANIIKQFMKDHYALKPLVMFIKHFLNMRGLNEVFLGGLGSYSIICLVISFLQRHPKLLSKEIKEQDNLGVLLMEFFELYGKLFNYNEVGICINNGGKYFSKRSRGWSKSNQPFLLSIQDPADPENDIAKSSRCILKIKATLGGAFDLLASRLYHVNRTIRPKLHYKRKKRDIYIDSILSAVVSIDTDIIEHRQMLKQIYTENEKRD